MNNIHKRNIEWVKALSVNRTELPYELISIVNFENPVDFDDSVSVSLDHVERFLEFRNFCDRPTDEPDQIWHDLLAAIDDYSYFACMSLPFARQVLEPSINFIYGGINHHLNINTSISLPLLLDDELSLLTNSQKNIYIDAYTVSVNLKELYNKYSELDCKEALREWCKYYISYTSRVIALAATISLKST